ncbi:MAG: hypothetical protein MR654_02395 [Corynebacterium glucuronolyticum]|nr:hypothetical protein [Corynebacterium glucuronolyticum]
MKALLVRYVPESDIKSIGSRKNLGRTVGTVVASAVISFVFSAYLFAFNGKTFEPSLTLTFVLAVYSSVLIIYKYLYVESKEKEFDPVKRFRFADEIKLGFIVVFCLSLIERLLSVYARGDSCVSKENTGELPEALIAENPVFRLISCTGGALWKNISGGDLIFFIVLYGLAFLALRSLRFVTENSVYSDDRLESQREVIRAKVGALTTILDGQKYNVRFFLPRAQEPVESSPVNNAQLEASDTTSVQFQMKTFGRKIIWRELIYGLVVLLVTFVVSVGFGMLTFQSVRGLPGDKSLLFSKVFGFSTVSVMVSFVAVMFAVEATDGISKSVAGLIALMYGIFGLVDFVLFALTAVPALGRWVMLIPLATAIVLLALLSVESVIRRRRNGRDVKVKFEKSESSCTKEWLEKSVESKDEQKYLWLLRLHCDSEDQNSQSFSGLLKDVVSLGCFRELFRHHALLWRLQDVNLAIRNYLAFSRESSRSAHSKEDAENFS